MIPAPRTFALFSLVLLHGLAAAPDTNLVEVPSTGTFSVRGNWDFSYGIKGPMARNRATLWTTKVGATATWNPRIFSTGNVQVSIWKMVWKDNNDPAVKIEILHNGKTDTRILDCTQGESGWENLGTFDFAGAGTEIVRLTKATEKVNTRASAVRFVIMNTVNGKEVPWQTLYVNADHNADEEVFKPTEPFTDIAGHPSATTIRALVRMGILPRQGEEAFRPNGPLTRRDLLAWMAGALGQTNGKPGKFFKDLGDRTEMENRAQGAGPALSVWGETLAPETPVTALEAAKVLMNAAGASKRPLGFTNRVALPAGSSHLPEAMKALTRLTVLDPAAVPSPSAILTRAQGAAWVRKYLQAVVEAGPRTEGYELSFQDEFEGDSLNWNLWESQNAYYKHIVSSRWKENVAVSNGQLHLVVKKESRGGADWTSGCVWVKKSNFQQTYGYWECRFRYLPATGLDQAFWMNGGYKAVDNFEIDVNEGAWPNAVNPTLHHYRVGETDIKKFGRNNGRFNSTEDLSADFHIYAVDWDEERIITYVDGVEIFRSPTHNATKPVWPIVSVAVIAWGGPILDEMSGKSVDFDWVRVWKKKTK